jgi:hypothetical protein
LEVQVPQYNGIIHNADVGCLLLRILIVAYSDANRLHPSAPHDSLFCLQTGFLIHSRLFLPLDQNDIGDLEIGFLSAW